MITNINENKILLISHIADIDGVSCIVLAKLIYKDNFDYILAEPTDLDLIFNKLLSNNNFKKYNQIFVTDLSIREPSLSKINNSPISKILLSFDHHKTDLTTNNYKWATVITKENEINTCGTLLFYNYLNSISSSKVLCKKSIIEFVEAVRSYDNYEFIYDNNLVGKHLTNILNIYGPQHYISNFADNLAKSNSSSSFKLSEQDLEKSLQIENDIKNYIDKCDSNLHYCNIKNYKVGLSISSKYRNDVGHALSKRHQDLDFILIADFIRSTFSIRTTKNIDVGLICKEFGGGGHGQAGGFPMNNSNLVFIKSCLSTTAYILNKNNNVL